MSSNLNPFDALDNVQSSYRSYVETFQNVDDETINAWIENRIQNGKVLWKEPFVQLNQRFQYGDALEDFVADGRLHEDILDVFTGADGEPIEPYKHQTEAIQSIQAGNNTIVSTGTGSGKSFAFGIPIVSHCLEAMEQGEDGIKAIIVYPMNALANSQYEDFAERLDGTGLKLGLYTGDTPYNPDSEQEFLQRFGRNESYDSELISREEMQRNPPDILMTNYVMLDLILTRLSDKQLFPDSHDGALQHLVLDEIHTYTGQQGADVAALVRRLREHTGVGEDLCCIGTSATVQSGEGLDADEEITDFASRIFGTDVSADAVVRESLYNIEFTDGEGLPDSINVSASDITSFDGDLKDAIALAGQLTTADLDHVDSPDVLGEVLLGHPTVEFLQRELSEQSQQVISEGETKDSEDLVDAYCEKLRPDATKTGAERELTATLLVGTVATTEIQGEDQPIFVPKLHSFFSQGSNLVACLTDHTLNDSEPHLSDSGDIECRYCSENYDQRRRAFQLSFCRSCGQEYYTVLRSEEGHLESREVSDLSTENEEQAGYVMRGDWDSDEIQFPMQWLDDSGMLRDNWEEARPKPVMYCPKHNRLTDGHRRQGKLDCGCFSSQGVEATWVKAPFLFCAECGVHHSRRGRSMELSKMFQFGSVGRSTAMDVLVGGTLQNLPDGQQKTIAFSDNRQDTALQAAHINNLFQRIKFRRALYQAVKDTDGLGLTNTGDQTFEILEDAGTLPEALPSSRFGIESDAENRYSNYLQFQALLELRKSQQRGQQSLEEVGLIEVDYENLGKFAALDDPWEGIPMLEDAEPDVRHEYVQGFLDLFRRASAVSHDFFTDFADFKRKNLSKLPDETLFHKQQFFRLPQGFSDETDTSGTEKVRRLTHPRSRHVKWTKRSLGVDKDRAADIIDAVVDLLSDPEELPLLKQENIQYVGPAYMLKPSYIRIHPHDPTDVSVCPKCKTVVTREKLNLCISYSCGGVVPESGDLTDSYFHDLYSRGFGEAVEILAAEHSGQVEGDERRELETRFRESDELNTIVCTPTMELGIDIGDLSSVFMRNVPPNPSNYSQRAGRAGRQNQPSIVSTFCGSGFGRQSHDQYFYQRPQRIISGEISPPTFLLDNEDLIRSHINSLVLEVIEEKLFGKINQILDINPEQNSYPVYESYLDDVEAAVAANKTAIISAVKSAFSRELASEDSYDWFAEDVIESHVNGFVQRFDEAFDPWRQEYARLYRQRRRLSKKADVQKLSYHENREREAIEQRMEDMRDGGQRFYTYQYLRSQGFLPNFGFPRSSCTLSFQTRKDDIQRDESKAIREFAPRNHVYYRGQRYGVQYANPRTQDAEPITRSAIVCPECDTIIMGKEAEQAGACHVCGESFTGIHPNPDVMALPDQRARSEENITSDDEERKREGYDIDSYYEQTDNATKYSLKSKEVGDTAVTYEKSARIITVNGGISGREDDELEGFALCGECNRWLTSESQIEKHLGEDGCYANADPENIERGIELYVEGNHDTITLTTPLPEDLQSEQKDEFYTTLREALYQGILVEFDLDEQELESFIKPPTDQDTDHQRIIIHETSEGGAGALNALMDETRLSRAFEEAIDVLHGNDSDGCERACYDCLMSYYNQREHGLLNRHVVLPWFESRTSLTLDLESPQESDDEQRYKQLKSACDSGLEIEVLDAIKDAGFELPNEAQKTIYDGDEPIAKPDFYYELSKEPIAIFVDGPDHEKQHIKADDREKRNQLRQMNYRVVAVEDPDKVNDIWPLY